MKNNYKNSQIANKYKKVYIANKTLSALSIPAGIGLTVLFVLGILKDLLPIWLSIIFLFIGVILSVFGIVELIMCKYLVTEYSKHKIVIYSGLCRSYLYIDNELIDRHNLFWSNKLLMFGKINDDQIEVIIDPTNIKILVNGQPLLKYKTK